jgi:hypothetical protein
VAEEKHYISRIKLADGSTAEVKDQEARLTLESLFTDTIILYCGTADTVVEQQDKIESSN